MLLCCALNGAAQPLFKTITAREGLTSSQINCVLKDTRGYMWFGTPAGLFRYDGYVFKVFQSDSQDGTSLPNSYIEDIQEALDGQLWIKTAVGYCVFDARTESFERDMGQMFARLGIEVVPNIIYIDKHKNLWGVVKDRGVVCYNMQQQLVYDFDFDSESQGVPFGNIVSIGESNSGAIMVYDDGKLVCCDVMHQQRTIWESPEIAQLEIRKSNTLKVFADQMDNIWLYGQGTLFRLSKATHTWDTHIGDQLGLTGQDVDNAVMGMAGDRSGNIWIGTLQKGLLRANVNTLAFESIHPAGLATNTSLYGPIGVQSVFVDDTDLLWVGTEKAGVAYWGKSIYKFHSELNGDITAMVEDNKGNVIYGTSDRGIIGLDVPLSSRKVTALVYGGDSSLWVGTRQNGLTRIKNGVPTYYSATRMENRLSLKDNHINALTKDKQGNVWIATDGGLMAYNSRIDAFSSYNVDNGKLKSDICTSLFYAEKGNRVLVGTAEGLSVVDIATGAVEHYTGNSTNLQLFTNRYVTQVLEDSRGIIWIGTREGVNAYVVSNDRLRTITERDGLCNNNICGIAEDKNHNIWLSTSNGTCRIVVQASGEDGDLDFGLFNYTSADGLACNEFNRGAMLTKRDGNVVFGSIFGTSWVKEDENESANTATRVILTQLFVGEEEIQTGHSYGGRIILPQALNETSQITLGHDQNTFTIKFAAGNFNSAEKLLFMYQLEGYNHGWYNGDQIRHGVTFRNLPSGTYVLHVKAVAPNGTSSNQERTIEIVVERHWLLSWWMLTFYAIVTIIVLYVWRIGIHKVNNIIERKEQILRELKQQSLEVKAASDDLKQPMARMASILGNLSDREVSLEEKEQLNALHSQMLLIITRVSDMQTALEHPEDKAAQTVKNHFATTDTNEIMLPESQIDEEELVGDNMMITGTEESRESIIMLIDDNRDFLSFLTTRLKNAYELHVYDDSIKAAEDIELLRPKVVICKQDMPKMSGSELCSKMKAHYPPLDTKFLLVTESKLNMRQMQEEGITLAADEYLSKPFNIAELAACLNRLLGLAPVTFTENLIEGSETRRLEAHNSSMTTASESMDLANIQTSIAQEQDSYADEVEEDMKQYSMASAADRQLMRNIEQYVLHNMGRSTLTLDELASAMGMGRVPLFQKVKAITSGKTPTELVRDLRLQHACILLQRTNINIEELANTVGFITSDRFITIFKDKYGMSPMEYRMQYRK